MNDTAFVLQNDYFILLVFGLKKQFLLNYFEVISYVSLLWPLVFKRQGPGSRNPDHLNNLLGIQKMPVF